MRGTTHGRQVRWVIGVLASLSILAAALPVAATAKRNLYVSNLGNGKEAAFDLTASGQLTPIAGSPYSAGTGPAASSITPDGRYLYVSDYDGGKTLAFSIAATGALTSLPGSAVLASSFPSANAITPDGRYLYVANFSTNNVSAFTIGADGSLTPTSPAQFAIGGTNPHPISIAVTPDGAHLYVANSATGISAFTIGADGTLANVAGSPFSPGGGGGISISPDGAHLYVASGTSNSAGFVNTFAIGATGALAQVGGSTAAGNGPRATAITPDGRFLYVTNDTTSNSTVSRLAIGAGGSLSGLASTPSGTKPQAVAIAPSGKRLYTGNNTSGDISGYAIAANGGLSPITNSPFLSGGSSPNFQALAFTPNQPPAASFTATAVTVGDPVSFDAAASTDSDGTVASYVWDFGDGTAVTPAGAQTTHAYASAGTYTARLTLTDNEGCSTSLVYTGQTAYCNGGPAATTTRQVVVSSPPQPPDPPSPPTPTDDAVLNPVVTAKKSQPQHGKAIEVQVSAGADEPVDLVASGAVVAGADKGRRLRKGAKSFTLISVRGSAAAGKRATLTLKPKRKKDGKSIFKLLGGKGADVTAEVAVAFTDKAGNTESRKVTAQLKLK